MGDWKIGDRVRIPEVEAPARQPHPEHLLKEGEITGVEAVDYGEVNFHTPVITLDDGSVVRGYECWWEPIEKGKD